MNKNNRISLTNLKNLRTSHPAQKIRLLLIIFSGLIIIPIQQAKSEEVFLKCTGKFEINRGELIKPDWETSYLTIKLDGPKSIVYDKGIKKEGRILIRGNSYTITHRDKSNRIKTKYKIHRTLGTYLVESPQINRTLIGTCQKGRG